MPATNIFKSRHDGLVVNVLKARTVRHPVTGDPIEEIPAIRAEFGVPGPTVSFRNPLTNEMDEMETFRGGVYDVDAMAEYNEWSDEIREAVIRRLDKLCKDRPDMIERVDYVIPPAEKPWPTYDTMADELEIVQIAGNLGLVEKTIAYECENANRAALVELLKEKLAEKPDPEPEQEPVVAVEPPKVPEKLERLIVA